MNYRIIGKTTGLIMLVEAACMLPSLILAAYLKENILPFLYTIPPLTLVGLVMLKVFKGGSIFSPRDAYVTVVGAWLTLSVFGCLPFYFNGGFGSFISCLFESVSGFTTTGASILSDIESLPKGILLWRSSTHFIGGMGILVLATAIMPAKGDRSLYLMRAEVPGPTKDKLVPKLSDTSKILYAMYIVLTLTEVICLLFAGLGIYDSVTVALATAGTGGFAVKNASIGGYGIPAVDVITGIYMMLFGFNFSIYFLLLTRKFKQVFKNEELRFYLGVVALATILISINTFSIYGTVSDTLRNVFFTVTSTSSSTGFSITDHDAWPEFSKTIVVILMIIGACAGSTGGGIKCSRALMLIKGVICEIKQIVHPRLVSTVRIDGKVVEENTMGGVTRFFAAYVFVTFLGTLLVSVDNLDFTTNFTAVLSCMSNIGPGLAKVGPTLNFTCYSEFSKVILTICMLIGRLEVFPILIFLSPFTWKKS